MPLNGAGGERDESGAKLRFLRDPAHYPLPTSRVEVIETHFAWVFLTDSLAYKFKKPIRFDRLDFSTLGARRRDCEEELRLNRRLAPAVYLAVVPLVERADGALALEGAGRTVEWLVKMVRLPSERMLDCALRAGTASAADVRAFARHLASFYRAQPPLDLPGEAFRERLAARIAGNRDELLAPDLGLPGGRVLALAHAQLRWLERERAVVEARGQRSRIVEGHGDLRPEHVCLAPVCVIDCLEFDRDLRIVDPLEELAFLDLECDRLGASWVAPLVLDCYASAAADAAPARLVQFHKSLRALNRAKIVAWHLRDPEVKGQQDWGALAVDYLGRAEIALSAAGAAI